MSAYAYQGEMVSTHSRAEAAAHFLKHRVICVEVSTHSRAEAAAKIDNMGINLNECFNTQPRGGGC